MMLRHALQVDQLNGYNLMSVEVMFRRMQTIEYAYAEKAREMEAKAIGANWPSKSSRCSVMLEFVKTEVERKATLAKNLRKAREEREAARKKRGGRDDA